MGNCCNCLKSLCKKNENAGIVELSDENIMASMGIDWQDILRNSTNESVPDFSVNKLHTLCKVVDVYDADTFRVVFFRNKEDKEPLKLKVRAAGCNAAEMYPLKSHPERKEEMRKARVARNRLVQLITGVELDINNTQYSNKDIDKILADNKKLVYIEFGKFDKYGRALGTLYLDENKDNKSINQILIDENHAVYYDGGKRNKNKLTVSK